MQDEIQSFLKSLQLVPSQNQSLRRKIANTKNEDGSTLFIEIDLAFQVAQACLGSGSVRKKSVDQTEADVNWSISVLQIAKC